MKIKKLNPLGFSHHLVLVVIVLASAIGGTYYLVASHADSCSDNVSFGLVSGENCDDTTSGPVAEAPVTSGVCEIKDAVQNPKYGSVVEPTVVVTNTGNQNIDTPLTINFGSVTGQSGNNFSLTIISHDVITITALSPGATFTAKLHAYTVPYQQNGVTTVKYDASTNTSVGFSCSSPNITLPVKPVATTPTPTTPALTYKAKCSVEYVPGSIKRGTTLTTAVNVTNLGTGSITPVLATTINPSKGSDVKLKNLAIPTLKAGSGGKTFSSLRVLPTYTIPKGWTATSAVITVKNTTTPAFSCSDSFKITK